MKKNTFYARPLGKSKKCLALLLGVYFATAFTMNIQAETGTTTATRIQRVISNQTISTEETKHQEKINSPVQGSFSVTTPRIVPENIKANVSSLIPQTKLNLPTYQGVHADESNLANYGMLAKVQDNKLWGLIDTNGQITIPAKYQVLKPQQDGTVLVGQKKKDLHYVDKNDIPLTSEQLKEKEALRKSRNSSTPVNETTGLIEYKRDVKVVNAKSILGAIINKSLNKDNYTDMSASHLAYDGVKRGYKDQYGNVVIDAKNDQVYPMTNFGTIVIDKGLTSFVTPQGKTLIGPNKYGVGTIQKDEGFLALIDPKTKKQAIFDLTDGHQLTDFNYDTVKFLGFNTMLVSFGKDKFLAHVQTGKLFSKLGINATIEPFDNVPYTWIKNNGNYTFITPTGEVTYQTKGDIKGMGYFKNGVAPANKNGKWGLILPDGNWFVEPIHDDIDML